MFDFYKYARLRYELNELDFNEKEKNLLKEIQKYLKGKQEEVFQHKFYNTDFSFTMYKEKSTEVYVWTVFYKENILFIFHEERKTVLNSFRAFKIKLLNLKYESLKTGERLYNFEPDKITLIDKLKELFQW